MCINICKQILCKYIFSYIANLKCTPSDRQMYPWGYMYPRLGTPALEESADWALLSSFCNVSNLRISVFK